ncbi:kinesin-like protein Klp10A isoform X2 [Uranotaenia lowii]|uniref:kinesin-like protein Klp10A isoform X2 n=1 Tax=Uranotaenia lowii TaxID=190385 RepID=UPI00247ADB7C|nr:kinesin-like protein Klp10A isoform X2 [Uranotaenia lowii]XP_055600682.1 kinesin-like protein Klp10A isoform X2 [Uranotaenia lowii]XP_055600690.1 kinesin-like protein Klp10A isoform X2 [Uranotaenia lowii]XP_055600696.1 kinesin-like protein Klp10A isoform X2 [Uranotaenia lowii]
MDLFEKGSIVNIKRSDGRVHSAMVSRIHEASRSVTVEWYERGETKGKEVELDMLLELNKPELLVDAGTNGDSTLVPQLKKDHITPAPANLARESSQSSAEDDGFLEDQEDPTVLQHNHANSQNGNGNNNNNHHGGSNGSGLGGGTMPMSRSTNAASKANATQGAISRLNVVNGAGRTARTSLAPNINGQDQSENIPPQKAKQAKGIPTSRMSMTAQPTVTQIAQPQTVASQLSQAASNPRRSYVVKEVERLKENREKRRAKQAVIREEKNALMNMDPGNPNWELSAMIREYQSQIDFRPLLDGQAIEDHQITVCVRKRPLSRKELMRKELDVICVPTKDTLIVHEPKTKVDLTKFLENHNFRFDYAFDDSCDNELVYKYTAKPLVQTIFEGGMATCFAYGQTGSGKTHTMGGDFNGKVQDCKNGIYAMAAKDVFAYLHSAKYNHLNLVVSASFFEIYSGKVFDLLSDKQKLRVLEDGKQQVQVVGLTEKVVDSVEEVLGIINHGNSTRTSGQTSANANSSRSHAVFQLVVRPKGSTKIHGKFSFIDLAGNERGADTSSANRQTRMEGAEINKSLLALKECIRALGKQNAHLPFRVSKLTQVLRDSFIGEKSKTCMIAMISPGLSSCEHTLNTLRYANRVKELVAIDPSERTDEIEPMESDEQPKNGVLSENDLAQLRSLNEHDMSVELYNQHAAISDLQQTEEEVVDHHQKVNEFLMKFLPESRELYKQTNYVDYDQDAYCKRGEELFTQLAEIATTCKDLMSEFRAKLAKEEMLSHKIKPDRKYN